MSCYLSSSNEYEYMKHIFELRVKDYIGERSSELFTQLKRLRKESMKKNQA